MRDGAVSDTGGIKGFRGRQEIAADLTDTATNPIRPIENHYRQLVSIVISAVVRSARSLCMHGTGA